MARICILCSSADKSNLAAKLFADGASDQAVAARLGNVSRAAVQRHRTNHIIKPAEQRLAVIGKGAALRQERQQLAQAAAADAPAPQAVVDALLGIQAQAEKLAAIEARLERMATIAEAGQSAGGVAQLSAQGLRAIEVGAKLAGVGGYAPGRGAPDGAVPMFSITIDLGASSMTLSTPHIDSDAAFDAP